VSAATVRPTRHERSPVRSASKGNSVLSRQRLADILLFTQRTSFLHDRCSKQDGMNRDISYRVHRQKKFSNRSGPGRSRAIRKVFCIASAVAALKWRGWDSGTFWKIQSVLDSFAQGRSGFLLWPRLFGHDHPGALAQGLGQPLPGFCQMVERPQATAAERLKVFHEQRRQGRRILRAGDLLDPSVGHHRRERQRVVCLLPGCSAAVGRDRRAQEELTGS
jgi:hypothetical protein